MEKTRVICEIERLHDNPNFAWNGEVTEEATGKWLCIFTSKQQDCSGQLEIIEQFHDTFPAYEYDTCVIHDDDADVRYLPKVGEDW